MDPQICLGSAQFGMDYGITNKKGKLSEIEIKKILARCLKSGIRFIDTAQSYGDSEIVLGKNMPIINNFEIINKLPKQKKLWNKNQIISWENDFQKSLKNLNKKSFNSFLIHNSYDLRRPDKDFLMNWLLSLKERKLIKRIGVSIYNSKDLDNIPLDKIQIVQLPLSIYDQRLLKDGTIEKLFKCNIAIHARSVFLQGLILQNENLWPEFMPNQFKSHHMELNKILKINNISLLEAAMGFVYNCPFIESFLVGVSSLTELDNIIETWNILKFKNYDDFNISSFGWDNIHDLDPRLWPVK
tara:strand:- start:3421 stop:4317 length:897 start_codon:yes stop_codon:yes gene_type:complete